jgi:hypothetical protein
LAFTQKLITAQISLASGQFSGGGNTYSISGLRATVHIRNLGGLQNSHLEMAVYGLPLSVMNQLSMVGTQFGEQLNNTITVQAGDINGMTTVFDGTLFMAFVDAQNMPRVAFRMMAKPGHYQALQMIPPTSIPGTSDVATTMQKLAQAGGFSFENNNVVKKLSNIYLPGAIKQQIAVLAEHAGIEHIVDKNVLAIWNPGSSRTSGGNPLISPATGMIGYPMFNAQQVLVLTEFNPAVTYGGQITIQSDLTPACGTWPVTRLEYDLECFTPRGKWQMLIGAVTTGQKIVGQ